MEYNLDELQRHLEGQWQAAGRRIKWELGPTEKLHPDFRVVEFEPGGTHHFWVYSTLGMSLGLPGEALELHLFAPRADMDVVELLVAAASYHRNVAPLGVYHTVNFGQPWLDDSRCDHGYISLPYLDGLELQLWRTEAGPVASYWLLPITEAERDFKIEAGWEALEELFEASELDYLDPARPSCV
ncbi:suppressor of fused domain protein [Hymenobacter gummosus]|uniref:Suppressor of fused domain protein n=1 Tax=Hymenobacter gummosus TaxID=1776032 RepID=A0A3S0K1Z2_9BACT|nr:suppressor of fused domain protein [Hymenobacter gummosus]RTQ46098.1 suppressor of fused domain protein [Hymenobacter gummosus]